MRIYLDYAAATPVRDEVFKAMRPYFSGVFANPSAIHAEGRDAREAINVARSTIARLLKIRAEEITFTSGGTEANNLAIFGVVDAALAAGEKRILGASQDSLRAFASEAKSKDPMSGQCQYGKRGEDIEIITTAIEHPSILEALEVLKRRGVTVHFVPVDTEGRIDIETCKKLLSSKTLLVTCAYANSEIGVVQDVRNIVRTIRNAGNNADEGSGTCFVHIDASQAPLWLPCSLESLGVDLMTLDAGKYYGPKGVGALAHKRHVPLVGNLFGGDQESGLRPGTENVPLIVGCAEALRIAQVSHKERAEKISALRDLFFDEIKRTIPEALINGSREHRVANNCNISIPGIDGEFAVMALDAHGIAASTRSACAGGKGGGSHVVAAITGDHERAGNTIRFTLGEETTKEDILRTVQVLSEHVVATRRSLSYARLI